LTTAQRPRPKLLPLIVATFPVSQHLAVIALFLAIFYAMLVGEFGAAEVGWTCASLGLLSYALYRIGWGRSPPSPGRELSLLPFPS
jgi:phosphatidylinositol glycan class C protein